MTPIAASTEPLDVEVREADPVRRVRRVLAIVRRDGLREALEVLGDLARIRHRFWRLAGRRSAQAADVCRELRRSMTA